MVIWAEASTWLAGFMAPARPATRTRPCEISPLACSRDRARPRRTSSASSLFRLVIGPLAGVMAGVELINQAVQPLVGVFKGLDVLDVGLVREVSQPGESLVNPGLPGCHRRPRWLTVGWLTVGWLTIRWLTVRGSRSGTLVHHPFQ